MSGLPKPALLGLFAVLAGSVVVMLGGWLMASVVDRELAFLTREPQSALKGAWYAGAVSNLGAVLWMVGITACGLAWLVERAKGRREGPLLAATLLLALLGADDFFLLHEGLYWRVIEERWIFGAYLVLFVAYLVIYRGFLRPHGGLVVLPLGLAFFGVSAVFDQYFKGRHLFEDGFKLAGIATVVYLFTMISFRTLLASRTP
jgi:hypothetical protein